MSKPSILAEPALVGREKELNELQSLLNSAIEGKGKTVIVSGEAGSGKTRLIREFLNAATKQGLAVMTGWCLSDAQVPYFPFMEAFNNYYSISGEGETDLLQPQAHLGLGTPTQVGIESGELEITSWLGGTKPVEKSGKLQVLSPEAWKDQVFAAVSRTLHTIAVQGPAVLFIEDLHWADSASLTLFHYVSRAIHDSERILVVATVRNEELTSDAEGHPHPLAETLRLMRREELFEEIKLSSLSPTNISGIAQNMIGGSLQASLAEKLATESKGNPLFVVELLRMLHERKSLIQRDNEWRLAVNELGIPTKIKDIIMRRLACLNNSQRRVLDAASVIGEEFDVGLLSNVLGQDSLDVLETLSLIARSTSIVLDAGNCYRFDHARSRETLYEELTQSLKRGYHNRVAEKLENTKSSQIPLSELAYHFAKAENKEKAVKYALQAGFNDIEKFSNSQAISHFKYVLETIGQNANQSEERISALTGLAEAYSASSIFSEATKVYEQLYGIATGILKLKTLRKAAQVASIQGNVNLATKLITEAENYVELDRLEKGWLYQAKAELSGIKGQLLPARDCGGQALQIFEEEYSIPDIASILCGQGFGLALGGQLEEGLANGLLSLSLYNEIGDLRHQIRMHYIVGETLGLCFLFEESKKILEKGIALEEKFKLGNLADLTRMYMALGLYYKSIGSPEQQLSNYQKALENAEKTDSDFLRGYVYGHLALAYISMGDAGSADQYYEKLIKLPPKALQSGWVSLAQVKTSYYASKGKLEEARKYFNEQSELVGSMRGPSGQGSAAVEVALRKTHANILALEGKDEEAARVLQEAAKIRAETLKRFEQVNLFASLMAPSHVTVGQTFEVRVDLVNVSRNAGLLVDVQDITPQGFRVITFPPECVIKGSALELKTNQLEPFSVKTIKLTLRADEAGTFKLSPKAVYIDNKGQSRSSATRTITLNAKPSQPSFEVLPERVATGTLELDKLLYGGIPAGHAVALTSPSSEEREKIIENYVQTGVKSGQITFYLASEPKNAKSLTEEYPSSMFLFVCNPKADLMVKDLPNVSKLKGTDNLTQIDIALAKAFRKIDTSKAAPRRACVEIVSDVLLQHRAGATRKWINDLVQELKSHGFTTLAVIDPFISAEEIPAIIDLFDGEIRLAERETPEGTKLTLKIKKLVNQKYSDKEIELNKEL